MLSRFRGANSGKALFKQPHIRGNRDPFSFVAGGWIDGLIYALAVPSRGPGVLRSNGVNSDPPESGSLSVGRRLSNRIGWKTDAPGEKLDPGAAALENVRKHYGDCVGLCQEYLFRLDGCFSPCFHLGTSIRVSCAIITHFPNSTLAVF